MNTVDGYEMSSWDKGYGDMEFALDFDTIRLLTHLPATAMIQCDLVWLDHKPVVQSPRTILKAQLAKAADAGFMALAGTELEFIVFDTTYEEAWSSGYRDLTPANQYNVDYSIVGTTRVEPLLRDIRNTMYAAGMNVEGAKGECNFGQHEIGFLYDEALVSADNHAVYKTAAKEIAAAHGKALTFMAKYNEREGNSCHIHLSLREQRRRARLLGRRTVARRRTTGSSRASWRRCATSRCCTRPTSTPTSGSPAARSRRRPSRGASTTAPAPYAWSGKGQSARLENRVPGGDTNPYLALAAMMAGGLYGIEHELELEPEQTGNAYASDKPKVPTTLREAREAWAGSAIAREVFGDEVVDHYTNMADVELAAFDAAVTDWELRRGFERM